VRLRPALVFFTSAIGLFTLLILSWTWVGGAYGVAFREGANLFFQFFGRTDVEFRPNVEVALERDTALYVEDGIVDGEQRYWGATLHSFHYGFVPSAIFLALVLATPVAWPRRLHCLLFGGLLLYAFVSARLALFLTFHTNERAREAGSSWWDRAVFHATGVLNSEPTVYALVPVLIWGAVLLRRSDLDRLVTGAADRAASEPAE